MSTTIENTVVGLFHALEARAVRYAVLRNYEMFPALQAGDAAAPHTDIDLVVDSRDLEEFRLVLAEMAQENGWDVLTECDHWAQSKIRHHNIEVFRFCRADPLEYLQVDVFHSVLVWGLPLFDEQQMLEGRIYDCERGLTRLDPVKENLHRMLQVHGLYPGAKRKRKRYREKVLAFRAANRESFDRNLRAVFSRFGVRAAEALERNDTLSFQRNMRLGRNWFAKRFALRHIRSVPAYLFCRLRENMQRYYTRQCGAVIRTAVRDEAQRLMVRNIMDDLVRSSFMDEWREHEDGGRVSFRDRLEMEQGALILEWCKRGRADLDLSGFHDRSQIVKAILSAFVQRHKRLYASVGEQGRIPAMEVCAR